MYYVYTTDHKRYIMFTLNVTGNQSPQVHTCIIHVHAHAPCIHSPVVVCINTHITSIMHTSIQGTGLDLILYDLVYKYAKAEHTCKL